MGMPHWLPGIIHLLQIRWCRNRFAYGFNIILNPMKTLPLLLLRLLIGCNGKRRSKNQSPAGLTEFTVLTLFKAGMRNILTSRTSAIISLPKKIHLFLGDLIGYWPASGAGAWKSCPIAPATILITILTFPVNAFAQNQRSSGIIPRTTLKSQVNIPAILDDGKWKKPQASSEQESLMNIGFKTQQLDSVIQIRDSVYFWNWDGFNNGWTQN